MAIRYDVNGCDGRSMYFVAWLHAPTLYCRIMSTVWSGCPLVWSLTGPTWCNLYDQHRQSRQRGVMALLQLHSPILHAPVMLWVDV